MSYFGLTQQELDFLGSLTGPRVNAFEWGSGFTTSFLAAKCRRVVSVEHQATHAAQAILVANNHGDKNASVLYIPPDRPYVEGGEDDGDYDTFRNYVNVYTGQDVDLVLVDGRARVDCFRHMAETAAFGPHPEVKYLLHDVGRPQYQPVFDRWREVQRVGELALLTVRT